MAEIVTSPNLSRVTIASAYLTTEAAGKLLLWCWERRRSRPKPEVCILVGSMNHFTQKAAIRALLACAHDVKTPRTREFPVALHVLRPPGPFHIKAAYAKLGMSTHRAIVGSHNLTGKGLGCEGELGLLLDSASEAKAIDRTLDAWRRRSEPWRASLRGYQNRPLPADARVETAYEAETSIDLATGETTGWNEDASIEEVKEALRITREFEDRSHLRYDVWGLVPETVSEARRKYPDGAFFDSSKDFRSDEHDWFENQRRWICRVVHVLPFRRTESLLLYRRRVRYRVTSRLAAVARRLKVTGDTTPRPGSHGKVDQCGPTQAVTALPAVTCPFAGGAMAV